MRTESMEVGSADPGLCRISDENFGVCVRMWAVLKRSLLLGVRVDTIRMGYQWCTYWTSEG